MIQIKNLKGEVIKEIQANTPRGANLTRADLRGADLSYANLSRANLSGANLSRANLSDAHLTRANLRGAELINANLSDASLSHANLTRANLSDADLSGANLRGAELNHANLNHADLTLANLSGADLRDADLRSAHLTRAHLRGADLSYAHLPDFQIVPQEGGFIGYKKTKEGAILTLEILAVAERTSSLVGRKCRASAVKVLKASKKGPLTSSHDGLTKYVVGEVLSVTNFDSDIRVECTSGIHFFITKKEAEEYAF